jgi:hypothetical protein
VIVRLTGQGGDGLALPDATEHRRFGDVAAVWGVLTRLDAAGIIDALVGDAKVSGGVTVGTYLTLAALNRICDPRSKAGFADWYTSPGSPGSRRRRWITAGSGTRWTASSWSGSTRSKRR